jgi:hypothetical protein
MERFRFSIPGYSASCRSSPSPWLAWWRARREGLDGDLILDVGFWPFVAGLSVALLVIALAYWIWLGTLPRRLQSAIASEAPSTSAEPVAGRG